MPDATAWRLTARHRLAGERFDLAIIGGGITGAGIARDAALRGLRVALLERADFAGGTSSRSSRLIHGGVRYLEHGHLHLVFEASRERRILLGIAPHLVRPLAFTWPVYHGARISRLTLSLGLGLYDALAVFRNVARHTRLTRDGVLSAEPALLPDGLEGGATYFDAATDDARLTIANVVAAVEAGAVVLNRAEVTGIEMTGGRAAGVDVHDLVSGERMAIRARQVVSAAGPWSDRVRALEAAVPGPTIAGSKGAHIAVPRDRVGNRAAITMLHPGDGRVLFTLPAGEHTIVGTTETPVPPGATDVTAAREDVRYLLDAVNHYFPGAGLGERDVVAAWAGIRPLARRLSAGDIGSASREHTIDRGKGGVVYVTGGKLTTYRVMASQVVDAVTGRPDGSLTARRPLPGGDTPPDVLGDEAAAVVADEAVRERLIAAYGSRWREVWAAGEVDRRLRERIVPALPVIGAELVHGVSHEMAMSLGDLLVRRTHLAFAMPDQGRSIAARAASTIAPLLGWDASGMAAAVSAYHEEVEQIFGAA